MQHTITMTSPIIAIHNVACLSLSFFTTSSFSIQVDYTSNGTYQELLLHRNIAGTMAWNRLQLTVPLLRDVDQRKHVFVFQSVTNWTGVVTAFRDIRLSMNACPSNVSYVIGSG